MVKDNAKINFYFSNRCWLLNRLLSYKIQKKVTFPFKSILFLVGKKVLENVGKCRKIHAFSRIYKHHLLYLSYITTYNI